MKSSFFQDLAFSSVAASANVSTPHHITTLSVYFNQGWENLDLLEIENRFSDLYFSGAKYLNFGVYNTVDYENTLGGAAKSWGDLDPTQKNHFKMQFAGLGMKACLIADGIAREETYSFGTYYGTEVCTYARDNLYDGVLFNLGDKRYAKSDLITWWQSVVVECAAVDPSLEINFAARPSLYDPDVSEDGTRRISDVIDELFEPFIAPHWTITSYDEPDRYRGDDYDTLFDGPKWSISNLMERYPNADPSTFIVGKPIQPEDSEFPQDFIDAPVLHDLACRAGTELGWTGAYMLQDFDWTKADILVDFAKTISARCEF